MSILQMCYVSQSPTTRRDRNKKMRMIRSLLFETGSNKCHVHSLETGKQMFTSQVIYLGIDDQYGMSVSEGMSGTDKLLLCDLDLQGFELHINVGTFF